jgi:aldose 1-epimerase
MRSIQFSDMNSEDLLLRAVGNSITAAVEIAVDAGARLRRVTIERNGQQVELLAPTTPNSSAASTGWGSFPMAPWAGRIRHGRFRFRGDDVSLDLNHADGSGTGGGPIDPPIVAPVDAIDANMRRHSIHGTTFSRPWTIDAADPTTCELSCSLVGALGWPYDGVARQRFELHLDRLELALSVEASEGSAFPATIGWHPWFAKPDRLEFLPDAMYARDEIGLPTGELVPPSAPPWDDCFVNLKPVVLHYDRDIVSTVTLTADTDHWVVYDLPEHATCVEPQSGPPDAANVRPHVVETGRPLKHTMTIRW